MMTKPNERDEIAEELFADLMSANIIAFAKFPSEKVLPIIAAALDRYAEGLREKVLHEAAGLMCERCAEGRFSTQRHGGTAECEVFWIHGRHGHCHAGPITDEIADMQAEDGREKKT